MQVTLNIPVLKPLEAFFEFLKKRATDAVHEDHVDMIADFVDKFLVVEMKRLVNDKETYEDQVEIPDDVIERIVEARIKARGLAPKKEESLAPKDSSSGLAHTAPAPAKVKRSGNGHQKLKQRDLYDSEKDLIRTEFLMLNGQIHEDACKPIHKVIADGLAAHNGVPISIAQVTGFVTYLHGKVAEGVLAVRDHDAYLKQLMGHRARWALYNSDKYKALRIKNLGHA